MLKLRLVRIGNLKTAKRVKWSQEQLDLKDEIINNYNPKIGIRISSDLRVLDGNHRTLILKEAYGDDYEVMVKDTRLPFIIHMVFGISLIILLLPFVLTYKIIKKISKKK